MIETIVILSVCAGLFVLLQWPKIARSRFWKASITPLASIIGSGFLVIGPILDHAFGSYAILGMIALCVMAYLFGSAIRQNIRYRSENSYDRLFQPLDKAASWALSFAYIVSVAYYLNLFGSFAVHMTDADTQTNARILTTIMLLIVLFVGWTKGFSALEKMEQMSVTVKLAIIGGLLVGLGFDFTGKAADGALIFIDPSVSPIGAVTLLFGLIVTVQGFEISRYMGEEYPAKMRISSMRFAQLLSSAIYIVYILLMAFLFRPEDIPLQESAIIDMMALVAPILPILLVAAALAAQFSAAIADTGGCGGLVHELTDEKVPTRHSYVLVAGLGIALTWFADVFEIISYASRAFALYYALQSAQAALSAWRLEKAYLRTGFFAALSMLGFAITLFGQAVE